MNEIRIALTNLADYNAGKLNFTWLTLPATEDELEEAFEEIGNPEEHFISDYEAPFSIGEYTSITKLNEMMEALSDVHEVDSTDASDVINFAMDLCNEGIVGNADEYVQDILTDEQVDEMVAHQAQESGWQRVAYLIGGIEFMNDDYFIMNGYGNIENISPTHLEGIVADLFDEIKREYGV